MRLCKLGAVFWILAATAYGARIESVVLVNEKTSELQPFRDGATLVQGEPYHIRANCSSTKSVTFKLDSGASRTDNTAPFESLTIRPAVGDHVFLVVPYARSNARRAGEGRTVEFSVTASPSATPTPTTPPPTVAPTQTPIPTATPSPSVAPGGGLASKYPGDVGIEKDPAVIFSDNFEGYDSASQLTTKWNKAYKPANLKIVPGREGKTLEITLFESQTETSNTLVKNLAGEKVIFMRTYMMFSSDFHVVDSSHTGIALSGNYPGPGNGTPADGSGWFMFLPQNNNNNRVGETDPGFLHAYVYWPKQRTAYGDHWYPDGTVIPARSGIGNKGDWLAYPEEYPDFKAMSNYLPERGKWICMEHMLRLNTVGKNDGECKVWMDGKLVASWPNLFIRGVETLKIDEGHIGLHAKHSEQVNKKWYDDVVIAREYIGPMVAP